MKLTRKQTKALDILEKNRTVTELLFGGGAGGGKSALGCYWILKNCINYPGTRWVIGRAKLKTLKDTTLKTLFEVAGKQGLLADKHYRFNQSSNVLYFPNGSEIILKDLFLYPSDPEFDSLGSLEITGAFVDECNQIALKAWQVLKSRIRFKLDENGLIPKILGTCNPAKNWTYQEFFKPDKTKKIKKHRAFIQSLLTDNPHISKHYLENLLTLDKASKERLLKGNWEYDDDPSALIGFEVIQQLWESDWVLEAGKKGGRYITADIALHGSDRFVIGVWQGFALVDITVMEKADPRQVVNLITQKANQHHVPSYRIVYDGDGLGAYLKGYLETAHSFHNGAAPIKANTIGSDYIRAKEDYRNLKSQCYFRLAELANRHKIYIAVPDYREEIVQELEYVKNDTFGKDGKLAILPKEVVKTELGRSPDFTDMLMMRMYFTLKNNLSDISDIKFIADDHDN